MFANRFADINLKLLLLVINLWHLGWRKEGFSWGISIKGKNSLEMGSYFERGKLTPIYTILPWETDPCIHDSTLRNWPLYTRYYLEKLTPIYTTLPLLLASVWRNSASYKFSSSFYVIHTTTSSISLSEVLPSTQYIQQLPPIHSQNMLFWL